MNNHPSRACRLALGLLLGGCSSVAVAVVPAPFAGLPGIPATEMARLTGGLEVGGLKVDLTAHLRTFIDGRLAAAEQVRLVRLDEAQRRVASRLSAIDGQAPATESTDVAVDSATAVETVHGSVHDAGNHTPAPVQRIVRPDGSLQAIVVSDGQGGATTVSFDVGPKHLLSTVANTANERQVHQQVDVEVHIHRFRDFSAQIRSALLAERIGRAVNGQ